MIHAEHLCKTFRGNGTDPVRAVDDVTLTIAAGRFAVVTGPSGSGKTTLLALLGALSRPSSGSIALDGRVLSRCSDVELARVRRRIGFVFQNLSLVPRLPVWENVTYPLIPRGILPAARRTAAHQALARLALEHKFHDPPERLSGGEQQRVAVARALACEPRILVADEPTSQLDQRTAADLASIFRDVHATGVTLVVSTHCPELLDLATDVYRLNQGRLT
jgi:putative ABC transport system ATP-binding protein